MVYKETMLVDIILLFLVICAGIPTAVADPPRIETLNISWVYQQKDAWFVDKALDAYPLHLHGQSQYDAAYNLTAECISSMGVYQQGLIKQLNWAVRMMDADGQPTSGMLDGNLQSLGSYDECVRIKATNTELSPGVTHDFDSKYCRAFIQIGDFYYTYTSVSVCVPETCTLDDVLYMLAVGNNSKPVFHTYCGERTPFWKNAGVVVVAFIVCTFIALVVIATLINYYLVWREERPKDDGLSKMSSVQSYDTFGEKGTDDTSNQGDIALVPLVPNGTASKGNNQAVNDAGNQDYAMPLRALLSFSLYRNLPRLLSTNMPPGAHRAFNGVRYLSMSWIILGHTWNYGPLRLFGSDETRGIFATNNFYSQTRFHEQLTHQLVDNKNLAVDTFLLISACLVSLSFMKQLERQDGKLTIRQMVLHYVHRYLRLTPVYAAILMIYTTLYYWGTGPQSPENLHDLDSCKYNWWSNLLYIHNFYDVKHMCMAWSWYLAIDWQYYLIAPLFMFLLYRFTIPGSIVLLMGYLGSLITRAVLYNDPVLNADFFANFQNIYIKPWCRFGPYAIGIALGYIMFRTKCKVKLPTVAVVVGWVVAMSLCLLSAFGTYKIEPCVRCRIAHSITFRDAFSLGTAWVLFACSTGYGGLVGRFLSWSAFTPLARLTYAGYLIRPIYFIYNLFAQNSPIYVDNWSMLVVFCAGVFLVTFGAGVITLLFEVPMAELEKVVLPDRKKKK